MKNDRLLQSRENRGSVMPDLPQTLGVLRKSKFSENHIGNRSVKDELRENLICKLQRGEDLFPGVVGYEDTVVPQIVNAVLSRHNFILLGLARTSQDAHHPHADGACSTSACPTSRAAKSATIRIHPICRRCRDSDR